MRLVLLFFCLASAEVLACGASIAGLVPGSKISGIQISEQGKKYSVQDDDGVLTGALAAAYCNQDISPFRMGLTQAQSECMGRAQLDLRPMQRIDIYSEAKMNEAAVAIIKKECDFDIAKMFVAAENNAYSVPLKCASQVKSIMRKAADRTAAYVREYGEHLRQTKLTRADIEERMAEMRKSAEIMESLSVAVGKPNATIKDFKAALEPISQLYRTHIYETVSKLEDSKETPRSYLKLGEVLGKLNVNMPKLAMAKCGGKALGDNFIQSLSHADWKTDSGGTSGTVGR